jgi:mercuric ion transport protein
MPESGLLDMATKLDSVVDYGAKVTCETVRLAKGLRLDTSVQHGPRLSTDSEPKSAATAAESAALAAGGIAALLAGVCCVVPFVLVSVGLGGAWLANLQAFAPYRPLFIGVAVAALGAAAWRIYRPTATCKPGEICSVSRVKRSYRIGFWSIAAILLIMVAFPYAAPLFT